MSSKTIEWLKAAGVRAIKTFAQTFIATVGLAMTFDEVDWKYVAGAAGLAAILSLATSLAGLPELAPSNGVMNINTSDPEKDVYSLELNGDVSDLAGMSKVSFDVQKQ